MTMHLTEDDLVLHYYGEMADREEAEASAHLRVCAQCHDGYAGCSACWPRSTSTRSRCRRCRLHFERTVWARLEPNMARERRGWSWLVTLAGAPRAGRVRRAARRRRVLRRAADAARTRHGAGPVSAVPAATAAAQLRERILLVDLSDHLEQSQMVLVELVSASAGDQADIADERERAPSQLVVGQPALSADGLDDGRRRDRRPARRARAGAGRHRGQPRARVVPEPRRAAPAHRVEGLAVQGPRRVLRSAAAAAQHRSGASGPALDPLRVRTRRFLRCRGTFT